MKIAPRSIGERIKCARKSKKISQSELAEALGVTRQQVGKLERGERQLKVEALITIASVLGVTRAELEGNTGSVESVKELMSLMGWRVEFVKKVDTTWGVPFDIDFLASICSGPMTIKMMVRVQPSVIAEDVGRFVQVLRDVPYHMAVLVAEMCPAESVREVARRCGVSVIHLPELAARLVDLVPYAQNLRNELSYVHDDYVEPMCIRGDGSEQPLKDVLDNWLAETKPSRLTLLGEPGTGKSTVCAKLATELAREHIAAPLDAPVPLWVPLWQFSTVNDAKTLVFKDILRHYVFGAGEDLRGQVAMMGALERLLAEGRFVLLLDGFDEMSVRSDPYVMRRNMRALSCLFSGKSRVLLTCRTNFFQSDAEISEVLGYDSDTRLLESARRAEPPKPLRFVRLQPFDSDRVEAYIRLQCKDRSNIVLQKIDRLALDDLARRPLILKILTRTLERLDRPRMRESDLTEVLSRYIDYWAEEEAHRLCQPRADLLYFLEELAFLLWERDTGDINARQLPGELARIMEIEANWSSSPLELAHAIRNCLFLDKDKFGNYRFTHRVFLEYLVARGLYGAICRGETAHLEDIWIRGQVVVFLQSMLRDRNVQEQLVSWLSSHRSDHLRSKAAFLLSTVADANVIKVLWTAFKKDPAYSVRETALYSLANQGSKRASRQLLNQANSGKEDQERSYAQILLVNLLTRGMEAPPLGLPSLDTLLKEWGWSGKVSEDFIKVANSAESDETCRAAAAEALGYIGDESHISALEALIGDDSRRVRNAARTSLFVLSERLQTGKVAAAAAGS